MLEVFTVTFFGHREVDHFRETEQALENLIQQLILEHDYVEFLIGRNGEFDQLVSSVVHRVRKRLDYKNCSLILVLPYMTAEFRNNEKSILEYYDDVQVSEMASSGHFKAAIQTRNKEMVNRADLVVFSVEHTSGGAYQTLTYADEKKVPYINIANM